MSPRIALSEGVLPILRCPACGGELELGADELRCQSCANAYPVVGGIPVLVDEAKSLFSTADFVGHQPTTWQPTSKLRQTVSRFLPSLSRNMKAAENYQQLGDLLVAGRVGDERPKVLVVGGSRVGQGMHGILARPELEFIETDVSFGPRTALICDAHDLPFADESVAGVIVQGVLQALVDPARCVEEIHRVLRPGGLVYVETPFMQQVCVAKYDFTRYTHLGHRRLFREFDEVASGAVCGPGMALAWSYQYFLLSFFTSARVRTAVKGFTRVTAFWLKYFDHLLIDRPGALDAASGYYFLGRKAERALSDRELVEGYRGAVTV